MKRLVTLLMAVVLAILASANFNVQASSAEVDPYLADYCNHILTQYPEAKEDPSFIDECGSILNNFVKIYDDPGFVEYCFSSLERYPEAKDDPYFQEDCDGPINSIKQCQNFFKNPDDFVDKTFVMEDPYSKLTAPEDFFAFHNYCDRLHTFIPLMEDVSLLDNSKSTDDSSSAALNFIRGAQGETCPRGTSPVTVSEARANEEKICYHVLHTWDIARLANGGAMDGSGYGCKIRDKDDRGMGNAVCK